MILFWPYMASRRRLPALGLHACGRGAAIRPTATRPAWLRLWATFDARRRLVSGLDDERVTGWHRKLHIFQLPFYYIEYGIAQFGALQVCRNALRDQAQAVAAYRRALALGGTKPLPELFEAADAKLAMDAETLGAAVDLIESQIEKLEAV